MQKETMEDKIIEVGMAQLAVAEAPGRLVTRGLGSCLGITIYDSTKKIGGMVHAMLPDIEKAKIKTNTSRFVNSAIKKMVVDLEKKGCLRARLAAKVFGGAHMFSFIASEGALNVGQKNIEMAELLLNDMKIEIAAQETGGTFGRTIELNLEDGKVLIKTVSWGEKEV
ncbi:MAG: chemotaxis protein CheD [Candidatus Omnitrophota bacterium]|nr:chemotaxis protein CheD [Candidatus Omnitrophota bacterium]MBU1929477.1 chemotaxis protein CheD [Candidatus Omnitrophota bacterium]MBU2034938.1 chemotaxis protein CheD [Candidatus Omnitrophota bacterium]MBU2221505.1 chemotaxis protein CheD [Candidatus Omnitrophota bacterium]